MPQTSAGPASTSFVSSVTIPKDGPTVPGPGGDLVTGAGIKTFTDALTANWATALLNFPDIWTAQWIANASNVVNVTLSGFSDTFTANLTLANYAQIIVSGTDAGVKFLAGTGATWFTGQAATWESGSFARWQTGSTAQWTYGATFQSQTEATFGNAVAVSAVALTAVQIVSNAPHTVNSGDEVIYYGFGGDTAINGTWYTWAPNTTTLIVGVVGNAGWSSGGVLAPVQFLITNVSIAANTTITAPGCGAVLSNGVGILLTGIAGSVGGVLNAASVGVLTVANVMTNSFQIQGGLSTLGLTYGGAGSGGPTYTGTLLSVTNVGAVVTTALPHTFTTGWYVAFDSLGGLTGMPIVAPVAVLGASTFIILATPPGGAYTSGGFVSYIGVQQGAATFNPYTAPSPSWDRVGTGGSIVVQRGDIRFVPPLLLPPTTPPAVNRQGVENLLAARGNATWTGGAGALTLNGGYNVGTVTAFAAGGGADQSTVAVTFATPLADGVYSFNVSGYDRVGNVSGRMLITCDLTVQGTVGFAFTVWHRTGTPGYVDLNGSAGGHDLTFSWDIHGPM
jgi:hypothetical protein